MSTEEDWLHGTERWREPAQLDVELWHDRTRFMVRGLRDRLEASGDLDQPLRLLEFGCGAMFLERAIVEVGLGHFEYLPSDVHARDERTLVLDLNQAGFIEQVPEVDVCFLGGVLEYLREPEQVLRALAERCRYLCLAYCVKTPEQPLRERKGWQSHLSRGELTTLLASLGGVVVDDGFGPKCKHTVVTFFVDREARGVRAAHESVTEVPLAQSDAQGGAARAASAA